MSRSGLPTNRPARRLAMIIAVVLTWALSVVSPAVGARPAVAASAVANTVFSRDGTARFEVLSPTLIRLEYAGDRAFQDGVTFNAANRPAPVPGYPSTVDSSGWRVITTGKLIMRYLDDSGPFTTQNLSIALTAGQTPVIAYPTWSSGCGFGQACEAEGLALSGGAAIASDHQNYRGSGFVAGLTKTGAGISWTSTAVPADGDYAVRFRYANSTGGDGLTQTRTISLVNGAASTQVSLPLTADWDSWQTATTIVHLAAGSDTLALRCGSGDSCNVNIDSLAVTPTTAPYPTTACGFGQACEAEGLALSGGAAIASDHQNYRGSGFVAGLTKTGAGVSWTSTAVPADGDYAVRFRYANSTGGDGLTQTRTISLVNGAASTQVSLPLTADWDSWQTATTTVHLAAGSDTLALRCGSGDSCNVNIDSLTVTPTTAPYPTSLGSWRRSLDGQSGPAPTAPGLLSRAGWQLLDDTGTPLLSADGKTLTQRPQHGHQPYQDGYFFGYGDDYQQALKDLHDLTGPAPLLPESAFGVWFSEWNGFSASDYQNTLIPAFRAHNTPLDYLVVDTDWKSPNNWDGWEWNPSLFPAPTAFLTWAHQQGLRVTLNIHPSITTTDTQYATTAATAGPLSEFTCFGAIPCKTFDFGDPLQLQAYFALHKPLEQQGVDQWWLDESSGESTTTTPGVTPDSWINSQYAAHANSPTTRGFALSRIGGTGADYSGFTVLPTGAWAEHRSTVAFTGDTYPTWSMLAFEASFTPAEGAAIGLPYVSDDIGGFNQNSPNAHLGHDDGDLYARWVQLGAFQPVLRLHSDHGDRLPWQYDPTAEASGEKFLQLREALVPYTYTLARQAHDTGLPITRPLYLDYPEDDQAYQHPQEYTYGDDVLVAPVTTPDDSTGHATTTVWFPPGSTWTDYFTGVTYQGGTTATLTDDLSTMPVFLRSGGIMTTRTNNVADTAQNPLDQVTADVATGADGTFTLYEDAGQGNDYRSAPAPSATPYASTSFAITPLAYTDQPATGGGLFTIGPRQGSYPGDVNDRSWTVRFHNARTPSTVTVGTTPLTQTPSGPGWSYDPTTSTLTVRTNSLPANSPVPVRYTAAPQG